MKVRLRQANLAVAGWFSAPIIIGTRLYSGWIWPTPGIENSLLARHGPNWQTENQTFQRAGCRRKSSEGNRRRFGLGTAGPPGKSRSGKDPHALVSPAARGRVPGTQRVELTGPETGGANEANRSGPATGRKSEAHGGGEQGSEARQGGGLKRTRYSAGGAAGFKPSQHRARKRWKGGGKERIYFGLCKSNQAAGEKP